MIDDNDYEISIKELEKYEGQWVAILNKKVVCGAATLQEAVDKFKKIHKKETPLLDWIPGRKEAEAQFF